MNIEGVIETETNVEYNKEIKIFKQINFMLCESCFWCASSLSSSLSSSVYYLLNDDIFSKCPICNEYTLKLIPIPNISLLKKSGWSK
ncbi:MAG TPA: hypothetical protein VI278_08935 [Nitrososphaeraceae archaeon]